MSLSSSHVAHNITAKARLGPPSAWFKNRKFRLFWRHDHAVSWAVFLLYQTVVETISCLSLLCVSVTQGPLHRHILVVRDTASLRSYVDRQEKETT